MSLKGPEAVVCVEPRWGLKTAGPSAPRHMWSHWSPIMLVVIINGENWWHQGLIILSSGSLTSNISRGWRVRGGHCGLHSKLESLRKILRSFRLKLHWHLKAARNALPSWKPTSVSEIVTLRLVSIATVIMSVCDPITNRNTALLEKRSCGTYKSLIAVSESWLIFNGGVCVSLYLLGFFFKTSTH